MLLDKYQAIWLSHSSIKDFLNCQRSYYYKNIYKNPKTGRKIAIIKPSLSLGQVVHDVIEELSHLPVEKRFAVPLVEQFKKKWQKISGINGGFRTPDEEQEFFRRGIDMINMLELHPGPLKKRAIKIKEKIPFYWFSMEDNMILCGKIDWLEYVEEVDGVNIIDFKTGKFDEDGSSLQLPIYYLLAAHTQTRPVVKMSYWYLDRDDEPAEVPFPAMEEATKRVMEVAHKVALARKLEHFKCAQNEGCRVCRPYEAIISGRATFVGVGGYAQDIYILTSEKNVIG